MQPSGASGGISGLSKDREIVHTYRKTIVLTNLPDRTSLTDSGRHLSKFEKRLKMPRPTALFALSLMQCQRRLQISRVKNIGNVFELIDVAFHLSPTLWWGSCYALLRVVIQGKQYILL